MNAYKMHPLVLGLVQHLPEPGVEWPAEQREKWLAAAGSILDVLYQLPIVADNAAAAIATEKEPTK